MKQKQKIEKRLSPKKNIDFVDNSNFIEDHLGS